MKHKLVKNYYIGLEAQLIGLALGTVALMTAIALFVGYAIEKDLKTAAFGARLSKLMDSHSQSLSLALWNFDNDSLETEVHGMLEYPDVDAIQLILDKEIRHYGIKLKDQRLVQSKTLLYKTEAGVAQEVGEIRIYSDLSELRADLRAVVWRGFWQSLLILISVGTLITLFVRFRMINPIKHLSRQMAMTTFDVSPEMGQNQSPLRNFVKDEIHQLEAQFQELAMRVYLGKTELKSLNEDLEQKVEDRTQEIMAQQKQLEASARLKSLGEMAGSIAHEINNPLAVIIAKAELMKRKSSGDEFFSKNLDGVIKTAERISAIVKALRVLARDGSRDPFEWTPLEVVISDVLGLSSEKMRNRSIELEIDPALSTYELECRRVQVAQILVNLMNNAVDAIGESENRWIRINAVVGEQDFQIRVTDSGPGVPQDVRDKILTPFFTTKEVGKGTGLGLSLSQTIMQSHNGRFNFDFSETHTTVVLSFPVAMARKKLEAA